MKWLASGELAICGVPGHRHDHGSQTLSLAVVQEYERRLYVE